MPPSSRAAFIRVTVANFLFFINFSSFFLLPLHVRDLGGSEQAIGVVMGAGGVAGLVSLLVVGPALDRLGRRRILLCGLATMGMASAGFVLVHTVGVAMVLLRVVQGVAFAAGFNAASTMALDCAPPERRSAALGLFGVSTLATHALAPTLGEVLVHRGGFGALFMVAPVFSAAALVVAWPLADGSTPAASSPVSGFRPSATLYSVLGTIACCGIAFGAVITYVPTFVRDADLGAVAVFFLSYTMAAVLTRVAGGGLGDSFGRRPVILPALCALATATALLAGVQSPLGLSATGLLFGTAQGFLYPTLNAFAIDQVETAHLGRAQTSYNGAFNLGSTIGSMALGPVVQTLGHRAMFRYAASAPVLALVIFLLGTARALRPAEVRP